MNLLDKKIIEYRIAKCEHPFPRLIKKGEEMDSNEGFYLQVLEKGLIKDNWVDYNSIQTYLWNERKFFRTESAVDNFVKANCKYNPAQTKFIKHPGIEIL